MSFKDTNITNPGTSIKYGADDMELMARLYNGVTSGIPAVTIKSTNKFGFWDAILFIRNQADTQNMTIRGPVTMTAARDLTMPSITANDTLAAIGLTNVWGVKQQYEAGLVVKQISSPSNPSSNYHHLFMNGSGHLISRTSAGIETDYNNQIFSGSSSVLKDYSARVYNTGGTYFAYDSSGNVISSGSVFETVAQAALNVTGTVLFAGPTTLACSGSFTGLDIPTKTHLVIERGCTITVPNAYTGYFLRAQNKERFIIECNGVIDEAGSPARNWNCFFLESTSASVMNSHIMHAHINNASTAIRLKATGASAFVMANSFMNIVTKDCKKTVTFEETSSGSIDNNMFMGIMIDALTAVTTDGFEDVTGMMNEFYGCMFMDNSGTMNEMNILSTAEQTQIIGGNIGSLGGATFTDAGMETATFSGALGVKVPSFETEFINIVSTVSQSMLDLYFDTNVDFEEMSLSYLFNNDLDVKKTFVAISGELLDNTSGTEDGGLDVDLLVAGAFQRVFQINQDGKGGTQITGISTNSDPLTLNRPKNMAATDRIGIFGKAKSSTGTNRNYGEFGVYVEDPTNASEDAAFFADVMRAGAITNVLFATPSDFWIFADSNFQIDFRNTGLTADRVITFPDATTKLAGLSVANIFLDDQKIRTDENDLLYLHRPTSTASSIIDINYDFNNSSAVETTFVDLRASLVTNTAGAEDGWFDINIVAAGSKNNVFSLSNMGKLSLGPDSSNLGVVTRNVIRSGSEVNFNTTSAEQTLFSQNILGNTIGTNGILHVRIFGQIQQNQATAADFTIRVKFGGTTYYQDNIATALAQNAAKLPFVVDIVLFNKNATGTQGLYGFFTMADSSAPTTGLGDITDDEIASNGPFANDADISQDTTAAKVFAVTLQMSVSNAACQWWRDYYWLEINPS